ncbi:MAG: 6-bladed beta-propeller [Candidatus Aminicenantes bacterium]|nr:6-bladed beta-propeller [Candidatus Aminicenantes bacterium]
MNKKWRQTFFILITACFFILGSCKGKKEASWEGQIETIDNVIVVNNPKTPLLPDHAVELEEELSLGGAKGSGPFQFSNMRQVGVDEQDRIFILDDKESHIKLFDSEGGYLFTFGKPGQGPGELNGPRRMCIRKNQALVSEYGRRLSYFSLKGEFLRSISLKEVWGLRVRFDSQGNIYVTEGVLDPSDPRYVLKKFTGNMEFVRELARTPAPKPNEAFNPFMAVDYWQIRTDDYLVYGYPKTYELQVFDPEGNVIRKITREYDPVEVTEEEKQEQLEELGDMRDQIEVNFSKFHSAYYWFVLDETGNIYVRTWKAAPDGAGFIYDLFDQEGKYRARFPLRGSLQAANKNKLYTIEEDDEGYQTAKRYRLLLKQ